jgi:hypothetical protein
MGLYKGGLLLHDGKKADMFSTIQELVDFYCPDTPWNSGGQTQCTAAWWHKVRAFRAAFAAAEGLLYNRTGTWEIINQADTANTLPIVMSHVNGYVCFVYMGAGATTAAWPVMRYAPRSWASYSVSSLGTSYGACLDQQGHVVRVGSDLTTCYVSWSTQSGGQQNAVSFAAPTTGSTGSTKYTSPVSLYGGHIYIPAEYGANSYEFDVTNAALYSTQAINGFGTACLGADGKVYLFADTGSASYVWDPAAQTSKAIAVSQTGAYKSWSSQTYDIDNMLVSSANGQYPQRLFMYNRIRNVYSGLVDSGLNPLYQVTGHLVDDRIVLGDMNGNVKLYDIHTGILETLPAPPISSKLLFARLMKDGSILFTTNANQIAIFHPYDVDINLPMTYITSPFWNKGP